MMIVKIALLMILATAAQAGSYSNVPAECIRDGVYVCYADHPALNSKPRKEATKPKEPEKAKPLITFKRETIIVSEPLINQQLPIECPGLTWKLTETWREYATYRGTVTPGSVSRIYLELRDSKGVMAEGTGYPKPSGRWEIRLVGDYFIEKWHKEKFYCTK